MSRNSHYSSDTMKAHVTALCNGFCYKQIFIVLKNI